MCVWQEAATATITLDDDDPSTVRRMLTYLYTLDYDDEDASPDLSASLSTDGGGVADSSSKPAVVDDATTSHCKAMNNVRVYALAEKYDISVLKELAKSKFQQCNIACDYSGYREIIDAAFKSTPDTDSGLRDVVIRECANNVEMCIKEEGMAPMMREHGSLGLGILQQAVKKHKSELEKQKRGMESRMRELATVPGDLYDQASRLPGTSRYHDVPQVNLRKEILSVWGSVREEDSGSESES